MDGEVAYGRLVCHFHHLSWSRVLSAVHSLEVQMAER